MEGTQKVYGMCMEDAQKVCKGCVGGVQKVHIRYMEGVWEE